MNPHFPPPDTGQPASEKSLHPKSFQSWRWFFWPPFCWPPLPSARSTSRVPRPKGTTAP